MAHGLEARSPFLDHELMQMAASIPAELKLPGMRKKGLLRDALQAVASGGDPGAAEAGILRADGLVAQERPSPVRL